MLSNPFEARRAINVVRNAGLGGMGSASYSFRKRNFFEDILYLAKVIDGLI
jgi:hypothetical protein